MIRASLAAAVLVITVAVAPATAAEGPLVSKSSGPVETTGPAANGDAKPFRTFVQAECEASTCLADFGKKGNKVRTFKWINCGINSDPGVLFLATITILGDTAPTGFMSAVSRGVSGDNEIAVLEFRQPFEVPAGQSLVIQLISSGAALAAQCIATGTIE